MSSRLPTSFTSLYRLFLRTTSESVLHHTSATKSLRKQFRPLFDSASSVIHTLRNNERLSTEERERLQAWLGVFDERVDNALAILANSAMSRGLSHKVISRISSLPSLNHYALQPKGVQWDPQRPPKIRHQHSRPLHPSEREKIRREQEFERIKRHAFGAVTLAVRMAEGRDELSLGRSRFIMGSTL